MTNSYRRGDRITMNEAAKLFAERDMRKGDDARMAEDRARKRIKSAAKKNALPSLDGGQAFLIEEFIGWARSLTIRGESWDGKFKGFPAHITLRFTSTVPTPTIEFSMTGRIAAPAVPAPKAWVQALEKANQRWAEAQKEVERLQAEIDRLRPDAEQRQRVRAINKKNGGKRSRVEKSG